MSTVKVNTVDKRTGSTLTLGGCGTTVTLGAGATQSGFGQTYSAVEYCTTAKTAPFTGVSGKGYFVNTTCGAVTVTLPTTPSAGDIVAIKDYANTFDSNNVTVGRGGSKIGGLCSDATLNTEGQSITLVYIDSTRGWLNVNTDSTVIGGYNVRYTVIAGGGGGGVATLGRYGGGGGGGGGLRTITCKTFEVIAGTAYPITVGAGGAQGDPSTVQGGSGSPSVFSTITGTGGGGAGGETAPTPDSSPLLGGLAGGSGGGGSGAGGPRCCSALAGGAGNTPPVSPPQGNNGGNGIKIGQQGGGGGGGAGGVGANACGSCGGDGGIGAVNTIFGSAPEGASYGTPGPAPGRYFSGGGGGGIYVPGTPGTGGSGGGGAGGASNPIGIPGTAGSTNTGGGGGGATAGPGGGGSGGVGGSGLVVIRYSTAEGGSGGNTSFTCGSDTIRIFTSDGTFTA
jgi:hypothetical protein